MAAIRCGNPPTNRSTSFAVAGLARSFWSVSLPVSIGAGDGAAAAPALAVACGFAVATRAGAGDATPLAGVGDAAAVAGRAGVARVGVAEGAGFGPEVALAHDADDIGSE